jgi:hypothetical protein
MTAIVDMTGERCGRLTVVERAPNDRHGCVMWRCVCDCGTKTVVRGGCAHRGGLYARSCGCLGREQSVKNGEASGRASVTHGHSRHKKATPTYSSWKSLKKRCTNMNIRGYDNYGGRGITVCERWLGTSRGEGFTNFLADMGVRPEGTTLDRIDVDGNYEPGNCRWATPYEQTHNRSPRKT